MCKGAPLLLVVLLAGGAIGRTTSGSSEPARSAVPPSSEQASPSEGTGTPHADSRCPGPQGMIEAFLRTRSPRAARRGSHWTIRGENVEISVTSPAKVDAEEETDPYPDKLVTLIATVPDPLGSGLDYQFDLAVSAIQMAAGAVGYSFATSWLPWAPRNRSENPNDATVDCGRSQPGVLIFRTRTYVLLAFLVGETPTAGVHPDALKEAIVLARRLQGSPEYGPQKPTRVLGPTYSGSAVSLARVLDRLNIRSRIISGSANREWISSVLCPNPGPKPGLQFDYCGCPAANECAQPRFETTAHTQEALRDVAEKHLESLGINPKDIKYLVESNTAAGAGVAVTEDFHQIVFPLHVSEVRRALDRERARSDPLQIGGYELKRSLLGLQRDRSSSFGDLVPAFSDTASNYEEMALNTQISAACQRRAGAFGVLATDARDKRFLIDRLRTLCPGTLVFTFEGDLLFAYPDDQSRLSGTLIYSSYPLFRLAYEEPREPRSWWSWPKEQRAPQGPKEQNRAGSVPTRRISPLADSASTGIYNAAITHLAELYEPDPEKDLKALVDYHCPFPSDDGKQGFEHPPVWISVASRNEILPVDAKCNAQAHMYERKPYSRLPVSAPGGQATVRHGRDSGPTPGLPDRGPRYDQRDQHELQASSPAPPRATGGVWLLIIALAGYCIALAVRWWPHDGSSRSGWAACQLGFSALALAVFIVLTSARPRGAQPLLSAPLILFLLLGLALAAYCVVLASRWRPYGGSSRGEWASAQVGFSVLALLSLVVLTSVPPGALSVKWILLLSFRYATRAAAGFLLLAAFAPFLAIARPRPSSVLASCTRDDAAYYWCAVSVAAGALGVVLDLGGSELHHIIAERPSLYFFAVRAIHLLSGVSPLLPLLMLGTAVHLLFNLQLRRAELREATFPTPGGFEGLLGGSSATVSWADRQLGRILLPAWRDWKKPPLVGFAVVAGVAVTLVVVRWAPTPEGKWFDWTFRSGFWVVALSAAVCWWRAVLAWQALRTILRRIARHPLRQALQALSRLTPQGRFANLLSMRPTVRELEISENILARRAQPDSPQDRLRKEHIKCELDKMSGGLLGGRRDVWANRVFREHHCIATDLAASSAVQGRWSTPRGFDEPGAPSAEELFIARQLTLCIAWVAAHIRELLFFLVAGTILIAVASGIYPFPATRVLMLADLVLLFGAAFTSTWIVYSFQQTEVAAWMAGARPGHVIDWRLAANVLTLCVIPIIAAVAIQFPDVATWIAHLLEPLLATVKG